MNGSGYSVVGNRTQRSRNGNEDSLISKVFFLILYFSINHPYLQSLPTLYLQPCFYPLNYVIPEKDLF